MTKIKLTALLIMSALGIISIHAELHHFLPTTNAYISIYEHKYWFEGDTIIDNKEYIKVYRQFCYSETECNETKDYYAAVRQDTINEKIYCIQVEDGVERLIADFDVKAGDEITIYSFAYDAGEVLVRIQDVDEIMIDGQYRKRISIVDPYAWGNNNPPYDFWVEGIGSIVYGLFFPSPERIVDIGEGYMFLCLHINNELIYQPPNVNTCYIQYETGISDKSYNTFNVSLSPTNDYLLVETELPSCSYMIYNNLGTVVKQGRLPSGSDINIATLNQGVYYVVFYYNKELIYTHKLIK